MARVELYAVRHITHEDKKEDLAHSCLVAGFGTMCCREVRSTKGMLL